MEPVTVLKQAHDIVRQAGLPDALHPIAFSRAVDLVLAGSSAETASRPLADDTEKSDSPLGKIAHRTRLDMSKVQRTWFVRDDGNIELLVNKASLPTSARPTQRLVALLIAGARQAVGLDDEWTSVRFVREELERYGRLDRGHFAEHTESMTDVMSIRGAKADRYLRMLPDGWSALAAEVEALLAH
jgi:hypothetical protein